jgi:hypothetical protein
MKGSPGGIRSHIVSGSLCCSCAVSFKISSILFVRKESTMLHESSDTNQVSRSNQSRRNFLQSAKWVVAGVSVAGVGLSLFNPMHANASNGPHLAPQNPDCIPCPTGCVFNSCVNGGCGSPPYKISWTQYHGGCIIPPQRCPVTNHNYCGSHCCSGVPSGCGCP